MIRIDREKLDLAIDAFIDASMNAKNCSGLKIQFPISREKAEYSLLSAMSALAPGGGPCTASDVFYIIDLGLPSEKHWPPK